jgi:transcriptional regulator with XRE-family HTH domain
MKDVMTTGDSPTVARRRVRLALREARESLHLTQSDVAEAMEWSLSKVIRIEGGEVSISPNDLRPLLAYLRVRDRARVEALVADAKAARSRPVRAWWKEQRFREFLTPALERLIEFESEAVAIRYFSIYVIPGPLQTPAFAEAILRKWDLDLSDEQIAVRHDARVRRREALLLRPHPPRISVLLDQSVLQRPIGGVDVLAAQLADLLALQENGRIRARIVPYSVDAPLPRSSSFYDALYLSDEDNDDDAVLYRELDLTDEIVEDARRASLHRQRFDELWVASLDEDATSDLIRARLKELGDPASA